MKKFNQRGAIDIILILVVIIAAMAFGGFVWYQQQQAKKAYDTAGLGANILKHAKKDTKTSTTTATTATDPYAGWKTYTSKYEGLHFKYPSTWTMVDQGSNQTMVEGADFEAPGGNQFSLFFAIYTTAGFDQNKQSTKACSDVASSSTTINTKYPVKLVINKDSKQDNLLTVGLSDNAINDSYCGIGFSSKKSAHVVSITANFGTLDHNFKAKSDLTLFKATTQEQQAELILKSVSY